MKLTKYVKKHAGEISQLEQALYTILRGTGTHYSVKIEMNRFNGPCNPPMFGIQVYIAKPPVVYCLPHFENMTAMIGQIKHDVKEARSK